MITRMRFLSLFLAAGLLSVFLASGQEPGSALREIQGSKIAREARAAVPYSSRDGGTMTIREGREPRESFEIEAVTISNPDSTTWTNYFSSNREGKLERFELVRGPETNVYNQLEPDDSQEKLVRKEVPATTPFGGSDFWMGDLGFEFLYWDHHYLVREQVRKTRTCYELRCTHEGASPYSKVRVWIDKEFLLPIHAIAYDEQGRKYKVFSVGGFQKEDGEWRVTELEMENLRDDSTTRIQLR